MPPKTIAGMAAAVVLALPVFWMDFSHRLAEEASPVSGKLWSRCQVSTSRWVVPLPVHTDVVMSVRRLRVKKDGPIWVVHLVLAAQIMSKGTSGQLALVLSVRLEQPPETTQRSA